MDIPWLVVVPLVAVTASLWLMPGWWKLMVAPPLFIIGYTLLLIRAVQNGAGNLPPFLWVWASIFAWWFLVALAVVAVAIRLFKLAFARSGVPVAETPVTTPTANTPHAHP